MLKSKAGGPSVELFNVEKDVFSLYLQHLYTQQLSTKPSSRTVGAEDHRHEISLLCKLFALTQSMRDEVAVINGLTAIYARCHERSDSTEYPMLPSSTDVSIIYKATDGPCGARKLMVNLHVWKAAGPWVKQHIETGLTYPFDFL